MRETDEELDARIKRLREQERQAHKELRAAEAKRERRREAKYEQSLAERAGFKSVHAWRNASHRDRLLVAKLRRMTIANGCTEAEAMVAVEMLAKAAK
jgi:hypothetical protein